MARDVGVFMCGASARSSRGVVEARVAELRDHGHGEQGGSGRERPVSRTEADFLMTEHSATGTALYVQTSFHAQTYPAKRGQSLCSCDTRDGGSERRRNPPKPTRPM